MWAQPEAGAEVLLAQRPARLPRASRAPQIWLPGFGCLAPASWSPGPRGDTWPPETELLTLEKRNFVARPSPAAGALRPIQRQGAPSPGEKSSHDLSSERERGASARWRAPGWPPADPEAESPRGGWELDAVGARTARARLHPLFRRAGSRARGLGAGRGRQSAPPGAGSAAGARRGLWGRRVPGPACPCPPPARHARLRLQVPGEAQAAAAVPAVREAHARAGAGFYLRPPLLRHLPAGVPQVRAGGSGERPWRWPWRGGTARGEGPRPEARRAFVCALAR